MKTIIKWMTAATAAWALLGCLDNGMQSDGGRGRQADRSLRVIGELGIGDSANVPGLGFADELGLTADQKTQIRAAVDALRMRLRPHHNRGAGRATFAEMKARKTEMRDSLWAAVMGALTPDQQALAQRIRDSIAAGERPTPMTLHRVARLTRKLGLDSLEQGQLRIILERQQGKRLSAFDSAASFEDFRARMDSLRAGVGKQIAAILTPQQDSVFNAMMQEREDHEGGRRGGHHRGSFWGWFGR